MTMLDQNTLPIHVYVDGPADAPALLLIHGTGASARSWDPLTPLLTGAHRVISVDLPGCGRSARPAGYAIPDQARLVGVALDKLGVDSVVAVGHSSGGTVATALAEQRPELVRALTLVNTGTRMAAFFAEEVDVDLTRWPDLTDHELRLVLASAFRPGYEIPEAFVAEARAMDMSVFAATSVAIRAYLDERALPDRLARVGKPLLVLFGEDDRRWRPSSAAEYNIVPGAQVRLLPGVGHSPNIENPSLTADRLLAFTADC